ncbi:hypothetical protein D3C75_1241560 [compost metagenome]
MGLRFAFGQTVRIHRLQAHPQIMPQIARNRNGLGGEDFADKGRIDVELHHTGRMVLRLQIADGHIAET